MNLHACIHKRRLERLVLLLLLAMASIGCATATPPFAQVESVVRGNRLATGAELQGMQVTRGDASLPTATGMALQKGDRIVTDGATEAVILFGDAYELVLGPDTEISILNPSIFMKFGKAVVKKLKEIREKFRVETEYVNAGVEHTEFAISVERGNVVSVVVLDGTVRIESKTQAWPPQAIGPREGATVRAGQLPSRRGRLQQDELDRTFGWARRVEAIALPAQVPGLIGQPLDKARAQLSQAGLQVGRIQQVAGQPLGTVVAQSRRAGDHARLGTRIDLEVAGEATVPDLKGMTQLEAGITLSLAGLKVGESSEEEETEGRPGRVVRQSPAPGTKVPPGTAVALVTASRTASRSSLCTVPEIRQVDVESARRLLEAAGLKLGNVTRREGGHNQQTPEPGARVACGSSVDLVIGGLIR